MIGQSSGYERIITKASDAILPASCPLADPYIT